jgi:hypothetical protein
MILKIHKIIHQDRTSSTQAYTIEVPTHSVPQLLPIIKDVTKDTKEYVAFQMRRRNPEAFQGAIRYQNHLLANQYVVMINNLGTEAMYYLSDRIKVIQGVHDVVPTKKVSENGKFYVLVDKSSDKKVRESLMKRFDAWYREIVPDDAKPKDGQFAGPPGVGNSRNDGYSSGENSCMTTSTKSFLSYSVASMEKTSNHVDEQYLDRAWETPTAQSQSMSPTARHPATGKTYASYASATISDQVSGITESDPPRDLRHEELSNKIATLETMIFQLCQQVQLFTANAAQRQDSHQLVDFMHHRDKRPDRKDSPRKHKKSQQYSAPSSDKDDTDESAPMDEDRLTVWDDYSPKPKDD